MTINVLINGGFGKMGSLAAQAVTDHPNLNLAGQTGREYDLKKSIIDSKADVVIDLTHPDSVYKNTITIIEAGARPVIGTSGLRPEQVRQLQAKCKELKVGGIIAPNFSLGAVLMMKCAKEIVKYLPNVEVIEMHHDKKADSPSGTAMRTAQLLAEGNRNVNSNFQAGQETIPHARGAMHMNVPIHSVRLMGLLAHEQIIFGNPGETLTLRHDSLDRICFMPGICMACEKVMELDHLVYGLEEIL